MTNWRPKKRKNESTKSQRQGKLIEMYKEEGPEKGIVSKNGEEQVNI